MEPKTLEEKVNEIHTALVGNPSLGQEGVVPRLNKVEAYQQKDKLYKAKVAGGLLVGVPLLDAFIHWLSSKF